MHTFRLAPMSMGILLLTALCMLVPAVLLIGTVTESKIFAAPLIVIGFLYLWVWLRFRPTAFVINPDSLEVVWPMKRRQISRTGIKTARLIGRAQLKQEIGWAARVGAGGLWGGFGCLWTTRRGIVQMYISRTTDLVWIERVNDRPWLVSPERPEEFVRELCPTKE